MKKFQLKAKQETGEEFYTVNVQKEEESQKAACCCQSGGIPILEPKEEATDESIF